MALIMIDENKCTKDGLCAAVCPFGLISFKDSGSVPTEVDGARDKCINCGHCISVCPHGALSLNDSKAEDLDIIENDFKVSIEQVETLIKGRRSVRKFLDKTIEKEKIEKLIDIARYAPTGTNSQKVQWLVVNSPEKVKELAGAVIDFFRVLISNNHPMAQRLHLGNLVQGWEDGVDCILRGAPALIVAHAPKEYGLSSIDSTIALASLELAAQSFGLGCCWAGFFMVSASQSPEVEKLLSLPEGNGCYGALMIGYKKYDYKRVPQRKKPSVLWME